MYLTVGNGEPQDLSSSKGWSQFMGWGERLEGVPTLSHLLAYGWTEDASALAAELEAALPLAKNKDVKDVGSGLLANVQGVKDGDVVYVNNGFVPG